MKMLTFYLWLAGSCLAGIQTGTWDFSTSNAVVTVSTATRSNQAVNLGQVQSMTGATGTTYFAGAGLQLSESTFSVQQSFFDALYYPLSGNPSGFATSGITNGLLTVIVYGSSTGSFVTAGITNGLLTISAYAASTGNFTTASITNGLQGVRRYVQITLTNSSASLTAGSTNTITGGQIATNIPAIFSVTLGNGTITNLVSGLFDFSCNGSFLAALANTPMYYGIETGGFFCVNLCATQTGNSAGTQTQYSSPPYSLWLPANTVISFVTRFAGNAGTISANVAGIATNGTWNKIVYVNP